MQTLVKPSVIFKQKSKFFLNRLVIYFSFLLIPVWIQKSLSLSLLMQFWIMLLYMLFMTSQWYLLGKEIDHRFKIFFRANSSIDRVLYRLIVGQAFTIFLFNLIMLLPGHIIKHFFWGFWVLVGLYYSWPTRGKIIEESVSTQFSEYKHLDNFEKTVLFTTILMLLVSIPNFPYYDNLESLKLLIDPDENISQQFWSYLWFNYFPFRRFSHLMYIAWSLHFYILGTLFFILAFYSLLRYFYSRRLSILGVFALVSSWSWSLILQKDPYSALLTTYSLLWIWATLWCMKSATYRSGLLYGLVCFTGTLMNYRYFALFPIGSILLYFWFMKEKSTWYRNQFTRYTLLGLFGCFVVCLFHLELQWFGQGWTPTGLGIFLKNVLKRKSFYILSIVGIMVLLLTLVPQCKKFFKDLKTDQKRFGYCLFLVGVVVVIGLIMEKNLIRGFGLMWVYPLLAIYPLEWIFQTLSRLRSRRNFIYLLYILVCLLDSHFEGRVFITAKFFKNTPSRSITTD